MTPQRFRANAFSVEPILNTYMTRLRVRLSDPELAAKAATRVTELLVELTARDMARTDECADGDTRAAGGRGPPGAGQG